MMELIKCTDPDHMSQIARYEAERMKDMQAYIGIRGPYNSSDWSDISGEQLSIYQTKWSSPVHSKIRVPNTKWCIMRYPTSSMAQLAGMSTEQFEDFYFDVCTLDYSKMSKAMDPLVELLMKTDKVRIKGKGTDLSFSIKGLPAIKCDGECNIPDGEVYTAPVKDSVNGYLTYNTPAEYQGYTYENIRLEFKDGKIVNSTPYSPSYDKIRERILNEDGMKDVTVNYSPKYENPYITYNNGEGSSFIIWYEDSRSVLAKIKLAKMFNLKGISLWRIGTIPDYNGSVEASNYLNVWQKVTESAGKRK